MSTGRKSNRSEGMGIRLGRHASPVDWEGADWQGKEHGEPGSLEILSRSDVSRLHCGLLFE